jgi:hypothetical protein
MGPLRSICHAIWIKLYQFISLFCVQYRNRLCKVCTLICASLPVLSSERWEVPLYAQLVGRGVEVLGVFEETCILHFLAFYPNLQNRKSSRIKIVQTYIIHESSEYIYSQTLLTWTWLDQEINVSWIYPSIQVIEGKKLQEWVVSTSITFKTYPWYSTYQCLRHWSLTVL